MTRKDKAQPATSEQKRRIERRAFAQEMRALDRALKKEVARDRFLQEWLERDCKWESDLAAQTLSEVEWETLAHANGCRTIRAFDDMRAHVLRTERQFLSDPSFKKLWQLLREADKIDFVSMGIAYSPANGGVPARLLDGVRAWHQVPKFTAAERKTHSRAIASACEKLEELLSQVTPSHLVDDQFSSFTFDDSRHARLLFRAFNMSPEKLEARPYPTIAWHASQRLAWAGVTPMWAVKNIRTLAASPRGLYRLPRKVRSHTAKRTHFIEVLQSALKGALFKEPKEVGIGPQLQADLVGLLSGMDCSADDVRKAQIE